MLLKNQIARLIVMSENIELEKQTEIQTDYHTYQSHGGHFHKDDYEFVLFLSQMRDEQAEEYLKENVSMESEGRLDPFQFDCLLGKITRTWNGNGRRRKTPNFEHLWVVQNNHKPFRAEEEDIDTECEKTTKVEAIIYYLLRNKEDFEEDLEEDLEEKLRKKSNGVIETKCMSDRELLASIFLITDRKKYNVLRNKFPNLFKKNC